MNIIQLYIAYASRVALNTKNHRALLIRPRWKWLFNTITACDHLHEKRVKILWTFFLYWIISFGTRFSNEKSNIFYRDFVRSTRRLKCNRFENIFKCRPVKIVSFRLLHIYLISSPNIVQCNNIINRARILKRNKLQKAYNCLKKAKTNDTNLNYKIKLIKLRNYVKFKSVRLYQGEGGFSLYSFFIYDLFYGYRQKKNTMFSYDENQVTSR